MNDIVDEGNPQPASKHSSPELADIMKPVPAIVALGKPSPSIEQYYKRMHLCCGEILQKSFTSDSATEHQISHNFIVDLEKWVGLLSSRPESDLLKAALREYQFALLAVVQGQYRQAFMALRLFIELALGGIFLSANELQLRVWLRGKRDINWRPIISSDDGVLSKFFVNTFFETLGEEAANYRAIAERLYRECSEYVHGNAATHDALSDNLEFVSSVFSDWHQKAASARLVVSFALTARYLDGLDRDKRNTMEATVLEHLGHIAVIRGVFEKQNGV